MDPRVLPPKHHIGFRKFVTMQMKGSGGNIVLFEFRHLFSFRGSTMQTLDVHPCSSAMAVSAWVIGRIRIEF